MPAPTATTRTDAVVGAWLFVLVLVSLLAVWSGVVRNRQRLSQLRSETVDLAVGPLGVRRELADGRREEVDWNDVIEVDVFVSTKGPHAPSGGAVVLYGSQGGCVVPMDRVQSSGLLDGLGRLPGFDLAGFARAVEQAEDRPNRINTVWSTRHTTEGEP